MKYDKYRVTLTVRYSVTVEVAEGEKEPEECARKYGKEAYEDPENAHTWIGISEEKHEHLSIEVNKL